MHHGFGHKILERVAQGVIVGRITMIDMDGLAGQFLPFCDALVQRLDK
jgi:hypothetical protein